MPHSPAPLGCPGYIPILREAGCCGVEGKEGAGGRERRNMEGRADIVFLCVAMHVCFSVSLSVTGCVCVCMSLLILLKCFYQWYFYVSSYESVGLNPVLGSQIYTLV